MSLNGIWQTPVQTGIHGGMVFAELGDDSLLAFLHDEHAGAQPDHGRHGSDHANANASALHARLEAAVTAVVGALVAAAAKQTRKLAVQIAEHLVKIRRLSATATVVVIVVALTTLTPVGRLLTIVLRRARLIVLGR
ncbi:hypothetical protein SDC9_63338 [bioreactor metagenome]|uniref:Uncharacterized protein n=1 Tax=bioreactor metagenome TaxID=1076179 RepID=A0A644XL83_9ZZZZ